MHVLFNESNSLSENDVQNEDFELGLTKKDCLPNQKKGKNPHEGSSTGPDSKVEGQVSEQTGRAPAKPYLRQKTTDSPESGARIGKETGHVTVFEPRSSHNQAEDRHVPRIWKHKKSHPLDQIHTDGVQTRSRLKNFCAFYAFLSHICLLYTSPSPRD